MELIKIDDTISYYPQIEEPLSSDVIIVKGDTGYFVFDAGNSIEAAKILNDLEGTKRLILSHFHMDHVANVLRADFDEIYGSKKTIRRISEASFAEQARVAVGSDRSEPDRSTVTEVNLTDAVKAVERPLILSDGVKIEIRPIPCSHSKGSLIMIVDDSIAFIGDAFYAMFKGENRVYNAQLLKEEIEFIKALNVDRFFLSHDGGKIRNKRFVLRFLNAFYERRDRGEAYIPG